MPEVMNASEVAVVKRIADEARDHLAEVARRYGQNPTASSYRELVKRQTDYQMAFNELARLHIPVG